MTLAVMTTTDLHGWILPWDYARDTLDPRYGLAKVATLIDSVRNVHSQTLLLDNGDWLQGNALADYFATERAQSPGYPLLQVAELLKYDAFVVGNHEFNYGMPLLDRRIAQSTIPVLGANALQSGTDKAYFTPWIMRTVRGVNIAIVGLTTPGSAVWDRPRVQGIIDFADGVTIGARYVAEARQQGADMVIVLAHSGLEGGSSYNTDEVPKENFGRQLAETVPGIDILVVGHSHRVNENLTLSGPDGKTVSVVQAGRWGSHLGVVTADIRRDEQGELHITVQASQAHPVVHVAARSDIENMISLSHEEVRAFINENLATTPDTWDTRRARIEDTPSIDLIHQVQLEVTGAQLSAASVFSINTLLPAGAISRRALVQLYPFENMLYTLEISGAQLRAYIEHTFRYYEGVSDGQPVVNPSWPGYNFDSIAGIEYEVNLSRPVGERLTRMLYDNVPVRPTDIFTIAVNSYRAEGGGGFEMLTGVPVLWRSDKPVRSYMEEYLLARQVISAQDVYEFNWRVVW